MLFFTQKDVVISFFSFHLLLFYNLNRHGYLCQISTNNKKKKEATH